MRSPVYILLIIINLIIQINSFDLMDNNLYQDGKEQYELITSYSHLPKYGDCWKNAIERIKTGCKQLNDHIQTNLAIMFTYCLLKHLKYDLNECKTIDLTSTDENSNLICYEKLKSNQNSFTTFAEFFTHTQNICFFLQNQIWNEKTLELVKESRKTQINLLQTVNKAVETQQKLIETNSYLQEIINNSAINVQNVLDEFNEQTKTQQMAIFHLFDRLQQIQTYILGEFTLFYSIGFYLFTLLISYILTSTKRTQSARAGGFILLTSMLLTECLIISLNKTDNINTNKSKFDLFGYDFDVNYNLYSYIWFCRKFYICLSFLVLVISAFMYSDYNLKNNKLLIEIKNEQYELKSLIDEIKVKNFDIIKPSTNCGIIQTSAALYAAESLKRAGYLVDKNNFHYDHDDNDGGIECSSTISNITTITNNSTSTLCLTNSSNDNTFIPSDYDDDNSFDIDNLSSISTSVYHNFNDTTTFNKSNASSLFTVYTRNSMIKDENDVKMKQPQLIINNYNLRPRKVDNYANLENNLEDTKDFIRSIKQNSYNKSPIYLKNKNH